MSNHELGIGMIGAGGIARFRHVPGLKQIEGVRFVAVANRTKASSEKAAREFGFEKACDHWKQVIEDPGVDAVFICTQPYMHREMTLNALEHGKHVFCQARMALDLEDALQMKAADEKSKLTTMLCPPPHYMSVEPTVLRYISEGKIGEIRHVSLIHATNMFLDPETPLHWRQRADLQGINLLDVGIMAEVLQKWFGPVSTVNAIGKTWVFERPSDAEGKTKVDLPDAATVMGEFDSGATLTCLFSGGVYGDEPHMTIFGSKGTITCYANKPVIILKNDEGEATTQVPENEQGKWMVEANFIQAVREGRKGSPSFDDGIRYMAFTQAVTDSIASGGNQVRLYRS